MRTHVVGTTAEVGPGQRRIVEVEGISIGVFNVNGSYFALRNRCPHQGAPLCLGSIRGTAMPSPPGTYVWAREGEILRCPWHGWEFDLTTGRSICNPHRTRVRSYEVTVEPTQLKGSPSEGEQMADDEDPAIETYPVTVEADVIVLHLGNRTEA